MRIGARGNTARFQAELRTMFQETIDKAAPDKVREILLRVRQNAEDNTRARLGSHPGPPTAADHWFAGPSPHVAMKTKNPQPGGEAVSVGLLAGWKFGERAAVWNNVYYLYFHEVGFYQHSGGARPKSILRDAVALEDGKVQPL